MEISCTLEARLTEVRKASLQATSWINLLANLRQWLLDIALMLSYDSMCGSALRKSSLVAQIDALPTDRSRSTRIIGYIQLLGPVWLKEALINDRRV